MRTRYEPHGEIVDDIRECDYCCGEFYAEDLIHGLCEECTADDYEGEDEE